MKYHLFFLRQILLLAAVVYGSLPGPAAAQAYPTRPIRLLIPVASGGSSDVLMRIVFDRMNLSQPVVVDNRPGAAGALAAEATMKAAPDGYTLMAGTSSNLALLPLVSRNITYDPVRDFAPVAHMVRADIVIVVRENLPVKNLQELIAYAKANPGKLTYGTGGIGSAHHLAAELFSQVAGVSMVHVPYKGSTAAEADLVGGRIDVMFNNVLPALSSIQARKTRAISVASTRRAAELPETQTAAEAGYPELEVYGWVGVFAPRGTPRYVVDKLSADIKRVLAMPDVAERLNKMGLAVAYLGPEDTAIYLQKEMESWRSLINRRSLKFE